MIQDKTKSAFNNCPQLSGSVLVIDNNLSISRDILEISAKRGCQATVAKTILEAEKFLDKNNFDIIFIGSEINDQFHMQLNLFSFINMIKSQHPELPLILMGKTSESTNRINLSRAAVISIRKGFHDFLPEPFQKSQVEKIFESYISSHGFSIGSQTSNTTDPYIIVGKSPEIMQTINLAKQIAITNSPVMIMGESGTGKELISSLVHHHSQRSDGPYIRINCASLNDSLLESELFGHERGAFTGAFAQRKGRFELAHGGTLLLDEITETPLSFQAKLLRVIEQQDFERVGGSENVQVNVRIISTTNKNILHEVQAGRFRTDLYYRLNGIRLMISPLRNRTEDLYDLVWYFVNLCGRQTNRPIKQLDPAMMDLFAKYSWPGNIRQLRNVIMTSLTLGTGDILSLPDISWLFDEMQPVSISEMQIAPQSPPPAAVFDQQIVSAPVSSDITKDIGKISLDQLEQHAILRTLKHTGGSRTKAAKSLGISDRTLRSKISRYKQNGISIA